MPNELARRIRARFPGAYDDLDDQELTRRVLAKYPEYADLAGETPKPSAAIPDPVAQAQHQIAGIIAGGPEARRQMRTRQMAAEAQAAGGFKGEPLVGPRIGLGALSVATGIQRAAQRYQEGASPREAVQSGLIAGGLTFGIGRAVPIAAQKLAARQGPAREAVAKEARLINQALRVRATDVRIGRASSDLGAASTMPGRGVAQVGLRAKDLMRMNPADQTKAILPHWSKAGQEISRIAEEATQSGVRFDIGKSVTKAIGQLDTPQDQERALRALREAAEKVGIQDWRTVTPKEALALRQTVWDMLPARIRGRIYGPITGDLKQAVPAIRPADQLYSDLTGALRATNAALRQWATKVPPSRLEQVMRELGRHWLQYAVGATGGGLIAREFLK